MGILGKAGSISEEKRLTFSDWWRSESVKAHQPEILAPQKLLGHASTFAHYCFPSPESFISGWVIRRNVIRQKAFIPWNGDFWWFTYWRKRRHYQGCSLSQSKCSQKARDVFSFALNLTWLEFLPGKCLLLHGAKQIDGVKIDHDLIVAE